MSTEAQSMPGDDFTRLTGIGPRTAEALHQAGYATMAQLAAADIHEVVRALGDAGMPVAESKIMSQRWLQQAWEISRPESDRPTDRAEPDESDTTNSNGSGRDDGWIEHAGFIIAFDRRVDDDGERWQTRVWDSKRLVEVIAPGTAPETWIGFVLRHANLPAFD